MHLRYTSVFCNLKVLNSKSMCIYTHICTHIPYFSPWFEIKKWTFNLVYQKILTVLEHLVEKNYTQLVILTSCFTKSIGTKFSHVLSEERYGKTNPELRKMQMKAASKTCYLNTGCWETTKLRKCLLEIPSEPLHEAQWRKLPESKELKISKPTVRTTNCINTTSKKTTCWEDNPSALPRGTGKQYCQKKNPTQKVNCPKQHHYYAQHISIPLMICCPCFVLF